MIALKKIKFAILTSRPAIAFLYRFIRLYSSTFRLTVENEGAWMDHLREGGRVVLCCWHQQFLGAIRHFKRYESFRGSLMISKSSDGDLIAGIARRSGFFPVRGSSSREGRPALAEMIRRLQETGLAAHILDGPGGPMGVVKAGVIQLASASGAAIVPFYTSADRAWYFRSWDRFMLPKPFARVAIRFGDLIPCPPAEDSESFERQRRSLEEIMLPGLHRPAGIAAA